MLLIIVVELTFTDCSRRLGSENDGLVYATSSYNANDPDELTFCVGDQLQIIRRGDENELEWWWTKRIKDNKEGYVPQSLLAVSLK